MQVAIAKTTLGQVLVAATAGGVKAILIGEDDATLRRELNKRFPGTKLEVTDSAFENQVASVIDAIENPDHVHDIPLDIIGTPFQRQVWNALCEIPPGTTATYSDIARAICKPNATRAVGTACGANHIAVLIPCHRIIAKSGALTGYRWGIEVKRELLQREQRPQTAAA